MRAAKTARAAPRTLASMPRTSRGRTEQVHVLMTPEEKALLKAASELGGEDLGGYVRRVALTDARRLLPPKGGA